MPNLIKSLIGNTVQEAVVQPRSEKELAEFAGWADDNRVFLTLRGKATSGYGGVLPINGGLVVDFYHMNKVVEVDTENHTATVQAGVVWEKLEAALRFHSLSLRLYPTSYMASTVGGWLAQGGGS